MISDKKVLAVIPARGGSKGLPRKNVLSLCGKPLLAWSIEEAKKSRYIDTLIVSSEDAEILEVARDWGAEAPFVRPAELSRDDTPGIAPVMHAVKMLPNFDYVVLLQPTSPLRTAEDIDRCLELCFSQNANSSVSVTLTEKSAYWACTISDNGTMKLLFDETATRQRRQELAPTYVINGAVYVADCRWMTDSNKLMDSQTLCYVMPRERSVDIDSLTDMIICEALIKLEDGLPSKSNAN